MKIELDRSRPIDLQLETICAPAVEEYGNFVQMIENASARIASKTQCKNLRHFLSLVTGVHGMEDMNYGESVFLTDMSDKIPFPKTVYHVTGWRALETLQKGKNLLPSEAHFLNNVETDKGLMLFMVSTFMDQLGIKLGHLEQFLFSGPEIDAEQVLHITKNSGKEVSRRTLDIFLANTDHGIDISPPLKTILRSLEKKQKPIEHVELKKLVDDFVLKMWEIPNIREGWLDQIKNILYGIQPIQIRPEGLVAPMLFRLATDEYMFRRMNSLKSKPCVILEIDTHKLIETTSVDGIFPVLVGSRPIESIFPSIVINPQSIKGVYLHPDDIQNLRSTRFETNTFDDIPIEKWLMGVNWRDAKPEIDNPLCAVRYGIQKQTKWSDIAQAGIIAPAKTIEQNSLGCPPIVLADLFGNDIFKFYKAEMFQKFPKLYEDLISRKHNYILGVYNRF